MAIKQNVFSHKQRDNILSPLQWMQMSTST